MTKPLDDIEAEALRLPRSSRAHLAEVLIDSLEDDGEVERAWQDELSRRLSEVKEGSVETVPSDQVFEELDEIIG